MQGASKVPSVVYGRQSLQYVGFTNIVTTNIFVLAMHADALIVLVCEWHSSGAVSSVVSWLSDAA